MHTISSYFRADIMNSKRQGRRKLGHVVQIDVFQYPGVNVILNLSYVR